MLGDLKSRLKVPSPGWVGQAHCGGSRLKTAFTIDEAGYPSRIERGISGFLLIVRTGRVFTAHVFVIISDGSDINEYRQILGCSSI